MRTTQRRRATTKYAFLAALGSAVAILFSPSSTAALTTVTHDTQVTINFSLSEIPPSAYDTLIMGFWDGGQGGSTIPTDTASLYNGSTLLGTSSILPNWGSMFGWVSPSSIYSLPGSQISTIDFSSISNGSINGKIVYQPGADRSLMIDSLASSGQPYSILLNLGQGLDANGSIMWADSQPTITGVSFAPVAAIKNGSYGVFAPDIPSSFPKYTPTSFGQGLGGAYYDLNVINGSVVIGVDVGLAGDVVGDAIKSIWETGIENAWSNKYELVDDALNRYPIAFDVRFSEGLAAPFADWVVDVHDQQANQHGDWVNTANWYTSMPDLNSCINNSTRGAIAAHEFGHFLGLYDEYTNGDIGPLGIHEGADAGTMGPCPTMPVQDRYFDALLANLNDELGRHLILAPAPGFSPIAELPSDAFFPPEQGGQVPEPPTVLLAGTAIMYCIARSGRRKVPPMA